MLMVTLKISLTISLLTTLASSTPTPFASATPLTLDRPLPATLPLPQADAPPPIHRDHARAPIHGTIFPIPYTNTHLDIRFTAASLAAFVTPLLQDAYNSITAHVLTNGDGLIAAGTWTFRQLNVLGRGYDVGVSVRNANNHQLTWGVLGATVWGLAGFMQSKGMYGAVEFEVWDGANMVGTGVLAITLAGAGG